METVFSNSVSNYFDLRSSIGFNVLIVAWSVYTSNVGLELAIDPPPPRGNFVHYDFLKLHYIRHKIKDVSPLREAALTCNITLYMLPPPPPK